ncbi:MAG: hypothetical protein K0S32_2920 [Bacteroidetes bacterium]|jgi:hypothetical protein|nr:hypothetical protein [Bacteroidota bacterium]
MENNKLNINVLTKNLLNDKDFKSSIRFEIEYAGAVKGGHLPYYFTTGKKVRLVNDINILSSQEQQELIYNIFTGKN